uniref:tumor necrosis factor receptor superfamily member 9a n=1 Tax=Semicossyphus pulcher TaxID=241346 RepID=UPI0037E72787
MAVILYAMALSLLLQGCLCSVPQANTGCLKWSKSQGDDVCCDICHPGNRLVTKCGPNPEKLCTPCEAGTFTTGPKNLRCDRCRQCVEAQVYVKQCTASSNTVCGCREGLICGGGDQCTFCVDKCGKGQEPDKRSCRPCPHGTFNNQTHQACKPWSTKCPNPDHDIVAKGNALSDIKCSNSSIIPPREIKKPEQTEQPWPLVLLAVLGTCLICFIVIITVAWNICHRTPEQEKEPEKDSEKMIIRPPSDDPRTLIAIECSFHEAQQEQGSSLESLASKDSAEQLLP